MSELTKHNKYSKHGNYSKYGTLNRVEQNKSDKISRKKAQVLCIFQKIKGLNKMDRVFPDSTRRGDAEAGDNNQIQVALVFIPFS